MALLHNEIIIKVLKNILLSQYIEKDRMDRIVHGRLIKNVRI